ncbi:hypothetical protein LCGC14_2346770 [marine sediment metagenome]|uniref:Uncharacterized protein n=1 Tax=marine sediment metagenome TaxID=412755 RepID=A0A0F9CB93_9ZZZZ
MATRIWTAKIALKELNNCGECLNRNEYIDAKGRHSCTISKARKISIAVETGAQLFPTWCPLPRGGRSLVTSKEGQ